MPEPKERKWTAEPETDSTVAEQPPEAEPTVNAETPSETPEAAAVATPTGPAARYAALERIEDDPDKPYFVTEWQGLRNYHCRACADAGKHFASTRLERTMQHFSERHLPQTVDLGLVTPSGRPLRIRR